MGVREQVVEALESDATLAGILTGGIYTGRPIRLGMGNPNPFDPLSGAVKPCAYVRYSVATPEGYGAKFRRQTISIFVYDSAGVDAIEAAVDRIKTILNGLEVEGTGYYFRHQGNQDGVFDDILNAYLTVTQYDVVL